MFRWLNLFLYVVMAVILQFTLLPAYLDDPFKPNLLIILVCYLALREDIGFAGVLLAYMLGLLHGTFSGAHFGLAGISMMLIFMFLKKVADQLYTDSDNLMIVVVFLATVVDAITSMLFILLFSSSTAVYNSILTNLLPQAAVNALVASLFFVFTPFCGRRSLL